MYATVGYGGGDWDEDCYDFAPDEGFDDFGGNETWNILEIKLWENWQSLMTGVTKAYIES